MKKRARNLLRKNRAVAATLLGVFVPLAACTTLFDSPPDAASMQQDAAAKMMNDLATEGEQRIRSGIQEVGVKAQDAANTQAANAGGAIRKAINPVGASKDGDETEVEKPPEGPTLTFERVDADMPQVAVQGLEEAVIRVDDRKIVLGGKTKAGRIGLMAPGKRRLSVECPRSPPFSADFYLVKGDRVVLRGSCLPDATANVKR